MTERVLITGGTGFVGRHLCRKLAEDGYRVRAALRSSAALPEGTDDAVVVGEVGSRTGWAHALRDVDLVVHAAARVPTPDADVNYIETNALGTRTLAEASAYAQVKRLVLLSSVKVNGGESAAHAYCASDAPNPQDEYARSKWQAERFVSEICEKSTMQYAIIRPPIVYGPGVRANFLRLMNCVEREYPLPVGAIQNRRSMLNVWNLSDLIARVLSHPVVNRTWMASDGEDLSTADLVRRIAAAMGRKPRLLSVPEPLLRFGGLVTGQGTAISRLCGSLRVNIEDTRELLGWLPPTSVDAALEKTVAWYHARPRSSP